MPRIVSRTFYVDRVAERGRDFYRVACEHDLEAIVAKWADDPDVSDGGSVAWVSLHEEFPGS